MLKRVETDLAILFPLFSSFRCDFINTESKRWIGTYFTFLSTIN